MKKFILTSLCTILFSTLVFAQNTDSVALTKPNKNIIKLNLFSLPFKNINLEYERQLTKNISLGLGFRYMPNDKIPFASAISKQLEGDADNWGERINNAKLGNYAITPTVRFYVGKGNLKGFYIAPFARYAKYSTAIKYPFDVDNGTTTITENIDLSGNLTAITGGLLFGSQFNLGKHLSLDWWIFGPQYGTSDGKITGKKNLSSDEQDALRDQLANLTDLPVVKTSYTVDGNGATVTVKGPWAGIRAGLCLGYRF